MVKRAVEAREEAMGVDALVEAAMAVAM
jgi:hypothetical protein